MRGQHIKKTTVTAAVILIAAAALIIADRLCLLPLGQPCLALTDYKNGRVFAVYPLSQGEQFSVTFIHSVNKSPVTETYELREDGIYVIKSVSSSLGAGMCYEIQPGWTQRIEDGHFIIENMDTRLDPLVYLIGKVTSWTLEAGGETVDLTELCGRGVQVLFSQRHRLII